MKVDQYISLTKLFTWRVEDDIQAMVGVQTAEIEPVHVGLQQPRQTGDCQANPISPSDSLRPAGSHSQQWPQLRVQHKKLETMDIVSDNFETSQLSLYYTINLTCCNLCSQFEPLQCIQTVCATSSQSGLVCFFLKTLQKLNESCYL